MKNLFKLLSIACLVTVMSSAPAFAVNGNQVRGVGAYGEGMSGAVTAAPFDTSTLVTNPAGITKIGNRTDMNFSLFSPKRKVDFSASGGEETYGNTDFYMLPGIGLSGQVGDDDTLFVGMGIFVTAGMGADFGPMKGIGIGAPGADRNPTWRLFSKMQFWKMTPTIAKKINDQFSIAGSININYQEVQLQQSVVDSKYGTNGIMANSAEGTMGYGFTLGALYEVNDMITFGANYSSRQNMGDMKYNLLAGSLALPNKDGTSAVNAVGGEYAIDLDFPSQWALGVAVKPMPTLLITADYKRINFSESYDQVDIKGDFVNMGPSGPVGTSNKYTLDFGWEDISVMAIAVQFQVAEAAWIRAGYNQSDSTVGEEDVSNNVALPAVGKTSWSLGATINLGDMWQTSLAYVNMQENTVEASDGSGTQITLGGTSLTWGLGARF
ncbi:hypothetical protein MNBD_NITROSPINAE02-1257 [hydrothermal vent metagenome]|uniref:Facilitator of salicylate uptake n=1 Tax=hydrothermal vent metagenome TaxID=652676 RepID=A0A3B1BMT0_9ZZZZ